jgi:hypothetical protein
VARGCNVLRCISPTVDFGNEVLGGAAQPGDMTNLQPQVFDQNVGFVI